jgi:hypothetical protein
MKRPITRIELKNGVGQVKATNFQVVHFIDTTMKEPRPIILLYALGEDGVVYEFANGKWRAYPINEETITKL